MTDCFDIAFFVLGALEVIITRNVFTLVLAQTLYCIIMYFCSMHMHVYPCTYQNQSPVYLHEYLFMPISTKWNIYSPPARMYQIKHTRRTKHNTPFC